MNSPLTLVLTGAAAIASFVAMLFFLKYWRRTQDVLFLLFALAFGIDALSRFVLGVASISNEDEPLYYVPRLVAFGLIILAIALKNRGSKEER